MFEETEKCGSYPREQIISEDLSKVIQRLELSKKDFKQIYLYRLKSLINNSHVNEKIYVTEHIYWKELRELINLYFI